MNFMERRVNPLDRHRIPGRLIERFSGGGGE